MTYFRAPTHANMPPLEYMLDDLATRDQQLVAQHLGITARTLAHWVRAGNAPRLAYLALFWETRWGLSAVACDAVNGERVARSLANSVQAEARDLRTRIQRLEETGDFGAANAPIWASR